jgi:putative addiction module component (TIGR02574 family)
MNARVDQLLEAALRLPDDERAAVVAALVDSLDDADDADDAAMGESWRAELHLRREDLRSGRTTASPWAESRARLSAP